MNRLLLALLIAGVGAGLIAGFMAVGGPGYARKERNDETRASDLRILGAYYRCQGDGFHDDSTVVDRCNGQGRKPDPVDPVTGAAYVVIGPTGTRLEICAEFETRKLMGRTNGLSALFFDGQTGCVRYARKDPTDSWVLQ